MSTSGPSNHAARDRPAGLGGVLDLLAAEEHGRRAARRTSAELAASTLREQVVEGLLRSGTRLPEQRLAEALGISRNTLREALSQLVGERILVRQANRGVVVATPGVADVVDVYRARMLLEPAALALPSPPPGRVEALRSAVEEGRTAAAHDDADGVASANQHFHRAVVALAGSERLDAQMDLLLAEMRLFFHLVDAPSSFHGPFLDRNVEILALLAAGDGAGAARQMRSYLAHAQQQMTDALRD